MEEHVRDFVETYMDIAGLRPWLSSPLRLLLPLLVTKEYSPQHKRYLKRDDPEIGIFATHEGKYHFEREGCEVPVVEED